MKKLLTLILLLFAANAGAQVKNLYAEARLGYGASFEQEGFNGSFKANHLNLILEGNITPSISYFWRQRFNKAFYNPDIPLNATDQLWIRWDINQRWAIQGGKIALVVGGYEFDDAPIDLYYWSKFADMFPDVYALGANILFNITPQQQLALQVTQSPLGFGTSNIFHAGLIWYGRIAPWGKTIWSANWMDDPAHNRLGIIGLGNRFEAGALAFELDFSYRLNIGRSFPAVYGAILKVNYALPKWNIFAKGGVDYNHDCAGDLVPAGTRFFYGGGGVEFFPLENEDIRIHAVGCWNTDVNCANMLLGVTYRLRVVK